jgi:hypothetical protein
LTVSKASIKKEKLQRPFGAPLPSKKTRIKELDDVVIQVTQVFCPNGHNLVRNRRQLFDGSPGISLWVSDGNTEGTVILSPYHGDSSRKSKVTFKEGTRVKVSCPVCKAELPKLGPCVCEGGGDLFMLYLTPELDDGRVVALCNVWGCHRSKVFDQAQLLSAYLQD